MSKPEPQFVEKAAAVTAVYKLPVPIWLMTEAFGKTYPTGAGPVSFDVIMPSDRDPVGAAPDGLDETWTADEQGMLVVWALENAVFLHESHRPASALYRVVITNVQAPHDDERVWRTADQQVAEIIAAWFDAVRTWAEVLTFQDLDPGHPVYDTAVVGEGLTFIEPDHGGPAGVTHGTPRVTPLRASEWANILDFVHRGQTPALEEVLSRDARAAHRRGANRRAILDAATALEIALGRHVRNNIEKLNQGDRDRIDKPKRPLALGDYIAIATNAGLALAGPADKLKQVARFRNDAAHRGEEPGHRDTGMVVQTTIDFLVAHGLHRRVVDDRPDGSECVRLDPDE